MKISSRGFTLVELMIVIAIIGILAAALFPAMSGYLARSRDTSRTSHISQIATANSTYAQDNNSNYAPVGSMANCINTGALASYMGGKVPTDPQGTRTHGGCTEASIYGYGTGNSATTQSPMFAISAVLENKGNGNTGNITPLQNAITNGALLDGAASYTKAPTFTGWVMAR